LQSEGGSRLAALSPNARGALWMLGSALSFTVMAACLKLLAMKHYPESQMVFARCAAGLAAIAPFVLTAGRGTLKISRPWPVLVRCAFSTIGFFAGFYAFAHLPLAQAQAISFSRVLFIVILAAWFLREKIAWRRWTAVAVGFIGVIVMARPTSASFDLATLLAVASAFFFAVAIVTVKDLTRDHSTLALVVYTNAFTTIAGLPFAFLAWRSPTLMDAGLFLLLGFSGVAAQSCYVRALRDGEASVVGMVDYARLPLAALMGFILFHEAPDVATLIGAVIIIAATGYITWRESRIGAAKPAGPETV
jgi:drug/metabolite transporter (DMT)-like permease